MRSVTPIIAGILVLAIAGCAAPEPTASPTATVAESASPAPTADTLPDDVAFVVSGSLVSPDGATRVGFEVTVGAPVSATAADEAAFAASTLCPPDGLAEFDSYIDDPAYVHVGLVTTLDAGTVAETDIGYVVGANGPSTWNGDYSTGQAMCTPPVFRIFPGSASGTVVVERELEVGDPASEYPWLPELGGVGFSMERFLDDGSVMPYSAAQCDVEFGPASVGTAAASLVRVDADFGCRFGFADGITP